MSETKTSQREFKPPQGGFSLIELIIAMVVFLIVTSAIYGLLRVGNISRNSVNNRSDIIRSARTAVNSIGKDIVNAGLGFSRVGGLVPDDFASAFLDIPQDPGRQRDLLTGIVAGNNIRESDLSTNGTKNDVLAFAYRDLQFNGGQALLIEDAPILGITNNSIVLKTAAGACAECRPFDLYLVESKEGKQAIVMATAVPDTATIVLGEDDPLNLNQPVLGLINERSVLTKCILGNTSDCMNYTSGVTAKKIYWVSFSVEADGTLIRTTYGNNTGGTAAEQIQKNPLVYGVQNFQIRYLMQDGTVSDDPSNGNTTPLKMNEVVQVEISVTIRSGENTDGVTSVDLINVTSSFSTRNLKYDIQ